MCLSSGGRTALERLKLGGSGATHVLYACSEDGGRSFRKADGQAYTALPITIARGDVVFQSAAGSLYNLTHVGVLPDGTYSIWLYLLEDPRPVWFSIWSDAMKDEQGRLHTVNYKWNRMRVTIQTE